LSFPDLNGAWTGVYFYPDEDLSTPFVATLIEAGGGISGMTEERDNYEIFGSPIVYANLSGSRDGQTVAFRKTYENAPDDQSPIDYEGDVNTELTRIEGQWTIPGVWSGRFLMTRAVGRNDNAVERTTEIVV
jgi:hypothetical protein